MGIEWKSSGAAPKSDYRVPEEQIKEAILHEDPVVRRLAVGYFANAYSVDSTVAPLAIQAIEQYGPDGAFTRYHFLEKLAHTDATLAWIVGELCELERTDDDPPASGYCECLCNALMAVDPAALEPHIAQIESLRNIEPEILDDIRTGFECSQLDPNARWQRFNELLGDQLESPGSVFFDFDVLRPAARLLRSDERLLKWVRDTLAHAGSEPESEGEVAAAVAVAGELRLDETAENLFAILDSDDEFFRDHVMTSLIRIGSDTVVNALARDFHAADEERRVLMADDLGDVRSDKSVQTLLSWLDGVRDQGSTEILREVLRSLLNNCVPYAIEPARDYLLESSEDDDEEWGVAWMRISLVALCTLTGADFPELEEWRQLAWMDLADEAHPDVVDDGFDFDEFDEDEELDEDDLDDLESDATHRPRLILPPSDYLNSLRPGDIYKFPDHLSPARNEGPKAGRNDPCPCGSGKKYKKCCLGKKQS
jgi:uncharacterized protein